jgi:hypothetical protein
MSIASIVKSLLLLALLIGPSAAQDKPIDDGTSSTIKVSTPHTSRALILCGLLGDADHRKLYGEVVERLYTGLTTHHGFAAENVTLLWSDEVPEAAGPALKAAQILPTGEDYAESNPEGKPGEEVAASSRAVLAQTVAQLEAATKPDDALWVFVFGHAHYDGRYSWLNIPGKDIQHIEFSKLFTNVRCREQAFFITTSVSGFFQKPLSAPGRVVITATEPDLEVNETLFPQHLAKTLAEPPSFKEMDVDQDGRLTLLDAYLFTCQAVAQEYATNMFVATEHGLLDDNGDGKATEIQADYLTEELGGKLRAGREKPIRKTGDGTLTRKILLDYPPSPPSPDDVAE